jgi:hypothetical protein
MAHQSIQPLAFAPHSSLKLRSRYIQKRRHKMQSSIKCTPPLRFACCSHIRKLLIPSSVLSYIFLQAIQVLFFYFCFRLSDPIALRFTHHRHRYLLQRTRCRLRLSRPSPSPCPYRRRHPLLCSGPHSVEQPVMIDRCSGSGSLRNQPGMLRRLPRGGCCFCREAA